MSDTPSSSFAFDSTDLPAFSAKAPSTGEYERGRQAIHALRGYVYQIYQTLLAWQKLTSNDLLFVEVSEDYAIVARDAIHSAQIRAVASSLSLGQQESAKPLNSLWDLRARNPGKRCQLTFLTTQDTCQEKSFAFPNGAHGIDYWNTCRNSDADVTPLRAAIQQLPLTQNLRSFVSTASDSELREELINRIEWICNRPDLSEIENLLRHALVSFGATRSMTSHDALRAIPALVSKVLHTAIKPKVVDRMLRSSDFIITFEAASLVSMPASVLREQLGQSSGVTQGNHRAEASYAQIVGERHRRLRDEILGYSLREFASFYKLSSVSQLEQWEQGEAEIPLKHIQRLERYFGVATGYLENRSEEVFDWRDARCSADYEKLMRVGYVPYLLQAPPAVGGYCWVCFHKEHPKFPRFTLNPTAASFSSIGGGRETIRIFMLAVRNFQMARNQWPGFFGDDIVYNIDAESVQAIYTQSLYSRDMSIRRGVCHEMTDLLNQRISEL